MLKYYAVLLFVVGIATIFAWQYRFALGFVNPEYGEKVAYLKNTQVNFSDFRLVYIGKTIESVTGSDLGITYFNFKVITESESKEISWSSGLGLVAPIEFLVGEGQFNFVLEQSLFGQSVIIEKL